MVRQMSTRERGLIDDAFDEGQYSIGMNTLDQMRCSSYNPWPAHIRQLIYLALYPPPPSNPDLDSFQIHPDEMSTINGTTSTASAPPSPSKLGAKQHRLALEPAPTHSRQAQILLLDFAMTNEPEALMKALPSFDAPFPEEIQSNNSWLIGGGGCADGESFVARNAWKQFRQCRSCWDVLKEGFVPSLLTNWESNSAYVSPKKNKRRKTKRKSEEEQEELEGTSGTKDAVGEFSWVVLQWLVMMFERDQESSVRKGDPRYSPLLYSQIPPPRTGTGGRWDIDLAIEVVLYCLHQTEAEDVGVNEHYANLGIRLLSLLINLTSTTLVDLPMFVNLVSTRLLSLSSTQLQFLLASLAVNNQTLLNFKLIFLTRILDDACLGTSVPSIAGRITRGGSTTTIAKPIKPRPKAQAKPRPKSLASTPTLTSSTSSTLASGSGASTPDPTPSISRSYPSFKFEELLRCLSLPLPESPQSNGTPPPNRNGKHSHSSSPLSDSPSERGSLEVLEVKYQLVLTFLSLCFGDFTADATSGTLIGLEEFEKLEVAVASMFPEKSSSTPVEPRRSKRRKSAMDVDGDEEMEDVAADGAKEARKLDAMKFVLQMRFGSVKGKLVKGDTS